MDDHNIGASNHEKKLKEILIVNNIKNFKDIGNSELATAMLANDLPDEISNYKPPIDIIFENLKKNKLSFEYMYEGKKCKDYFDITHNKLSQYHELYQGEHDMLQDLVKEHPEYIGKHIFDVGGGDGIKVLDMLDTGIQQKLLPEDTTYTNLDGSKGMLFLAQRYSQTLKSQIKCNFKTEFFQNINGLKEQTPKTLLFIGGTIGNLGNIENLDTFLEDISSQLQEDDTFIVSYFPVQKLNERKDLNNVELKKKQRRFLEMRKDMIDSFTNRKEAEFDVKLFKETLPDAILNDIISNLFLGNKPDMIYIQKLTQIRAKDITIDINPEDIEYDIYLDEDTGKLHDIRSIKRDIYRNIEGDIPAELKKGIVMEKGIIGKSEGILLDNNFFRSEIKDYQKNTSEYLYKSKESNDIIRKFLKEEFDLNREDYDIVEEYDPASHTLNIYFQARKEVTFRNLVTKEQIIKTNKDKILIHSSRRFEDESLSGPNGILSKNNLEAIDTYKTTNPLQFDQSHIKLLVCRKNK